MANDNWSPFYPTVFQPAQESTALQRRMSADLQTVVRNLSLAVVRKSPPITIPVDALREIIESADQMRSSLDLGFERINSNLESLVSSFEWNIGLLHEGIMAQTSILQEIAYQQRIPDELHAREHFTKGQALTTQLVKSIQTDRLDAQQIAKLYLLIYEQYQEALDIKPSGELRYVILLGRAELNILGKKNDQVISDLKESIICAPIEGTFDYISYSCRILGRIAFAARDQLLAIEYLLEAVKHSPDYAIANYDLAQYMAQYPQGFDVTLTLQYLSNAIKLRPNFIVMAKLEPNFDPIRDEVEELIKLIFEKKEADLRERTEELRQSQISTISVSNTKVQKIKTIYYNKNIRTMGDLANGLTRKMYPGCLNKRHITASDEKVLSLSSLQDRIKSCTTLESLQALSTEVANFNKNCDDLLSQFEKVIYTWKHLPLETRDWLKKIQGGIEDCKSNIVGLTPPFRLFRNDTLGDADARRKIKIQEDRMNEYLSLGLEITKLLREFKVALAASKL